MGTSAPDLVGSPSNNQLIMKQFVVLLAFLSPLALAEADASYGIHGGALGYAGSVGIAAAPVAVAQRAITAPHCQTTYDTVTSQQCHTVSEPVCHTRPAPVAAVGYGVGIGAGVGAIGGYAAGVTGVGAVGYPAGVTPVAAAGLGYAH